MKHLIKIFTLLILLAKVNGAEFSIESLRSEIDIMKSKLESLNVNSAKEFMMIYAGEKSLANAIKQNGNIDEAAKTFYEDFREKLLNALKNTSDKNGVVNNDEKTIEFEIGDEGHPKSIKFCFVNDKWIIIDGKKG